MNRNPSTIQELESGFVANLAAIKMVALTHQDAANAKKEFNQKVFLNKIKRTKLIQTACKNVHFRKKKKRNKIIN